MGIVLGIFLSLLAGVVPIAIYATVLWWFDRYEKEPLWLLAVTFLWGAIPAIILSLIVELILGVPVSVLGEGLLTEVVESGGVAPVIEEIAKAAALLGLFAFLRREFDNILDGIIYVQTTFSIHQTQCSKMSHPDSMNSSQRLRLWKAELFQ